MKIQSVTYTFAVTLALALTVTLILISSCPLMAKDKTSHFHSQLSQNKRAFSNFTKCRQQPIRIREICQKRYLHPSISRAIRDAFLLWPRSDLKPSPAYFCKKKDKKRLGRLFKKTDKVLCFHTAYGGKKITGFVQFQNYKKEFRIRTVR